MKNTDLHSDALELLEDINKTIEDKERLEVLNMHMKCVVKELNNDLIDSIIPKEA